MRTVIISYAVLAVCCSAVHIDTTLHPLGTPIRLLDAHELQAELDAQRLANPPQFPWQSFSAGYVSLALAATVDWRQKGGVTPAKDQGPHGFCGTFARVAAAEGQFALHSGEPQANFSVQQLVDCVGWDLDQSSVIVDGHTGFMTSERYPYNESCATPSQCDADPPVPGNPCRYERSQIVHGSAGFTNMTSVPLASGKADEDQLAAFVHHNGPVTIGIYAPVFGLRDNSTCGGVGGGCWVTSAACDTVKGKSIDHSITIIGYGVDQTIDARTGKPYGKYWLIKNSWSTSFADNGFIKIARGVKCGNLLEADATLYTYGDPAAYYEAA